MATNGGPFPSFPHLMLLLLICDVWASSSISESHIYILLNDYMINAMDRSTQIRAMASETRMAILRMLSNPSRNFGGQWSADPVEFGVCMTLIAEALNVAQPTASRHLDILKQATFITVKRQQKWSYCQRDEEAISEYLNWLRQELGSST